MALVAFQKRKRTIARKQNQYKIKLEDTVRERTQELNEVICELKSLQRKTEQESNTKNRILHSTVAISALMMHMVSSTGYQW